MFAPYWKINDEQKCKECKEYNGYINGLCSYCHRGCSCDECYKLGETCEPCKDLERLVKTYEFEDLAKYEKSRHGDVIKYRQELIKKYMCSIIESNETYKIIDNKIIIKGICKLLNKADNLQDVANICKGFLSDNDVVLSDDFIKIYHSIKQEVINNFRVKHFLMRYSIDTWNLHKDREICGSIIGCYYMMDRKSPSTITELYDYIKFNKRFSKGSGCSGIQ